MITKMGLEVDACEDFYKYACQAYSREELRPPDKASWGVFAETGKKTSSLIRGLLDNNDTTQNGQASTAIHKSKQFYRACMNTTNKDLQGTTYLLELIKSIGSWPVTTDAVSGQWDQSDWSFENALSKSHAIGATPFFEVEINTDLMNSSVNVIQADQSGLLFPSNEVYSGESEETFHQAYIKFFKDVTALLGAKSTEAQKYAEDVWQLEKALAGAFASQNERVDIRTLYNIMTVQQLQVILDRDESDHPINMPRFLKKHLRVDIPTTEKIMVAVPDYFRKTGAIVKKARPETLASYIVWSVVRSMASHAGSAYEKAVNRLEESLTGVTSSPPLWEQCVTQVNTVLGFASGSLYVVKYFSVTDKKNIEDIVRIFIEEFETQLSSMDWMDLDTRRQARDKALAIEYKVGYPDFILNHQLLDQYYQNLTISNSAFVNIINYRKFQIELNIKKFRKTPNKTEWQDTPTEVNAYYAPSANQIVLPAGILQPPFYHHTFPKSVVFGAIGFIIGHELMHSFDNTGRQFDKYGNMVDWWGNGSAKEFLKRSQCFKEEYSKFEVNGHRLNGLTTLGENIADNGGMKLSYAAYNRWVKMNDNEASDKVLPGLNMTRDQLFFLSSAQIWCGSSTDQSIVQSILTDPHSNRRYRVNGVVRNMPNFAQSFFCSKKAALNPKERCTLW
jgi:predicted metalloendopeptidase